MSGNLKVVGSGPGDHRELSPRALNALKEAETIVGYPRYIDLIGDLISDKELITTGMKKEKERAYAALEAARRGKAVCLVSGGDPGVYGLAGLLLELATEEEQEDLSLEVVPGITAATAAASSLGAPLTHDFAVISLSDLLTDTELIRKRLGLAAEGDFVTVIYNPKSRRRTELFFLLPEIFLPHRSPTTPVGIVSNAGRVEEERIITDLERLPDHADSVQMGTTLIIGNSHTYVKGRFIITPRGYEV